MPRVCCFYPGICLTTEVKARKKPQSGWKTSIRDIQRKFHTTLTRRIIQCTESIYLVFLSHNSQRTKKTISRFSCISVLLFLDRRSNGAGYRKCSIYSKDPPTPTPRATATKKLFPAERTEGERREERRGTEVWAVTRFWYTASVKLVKVAADKITLFFSLTLFLSLSLPRKWNSHAVLSVQAPIQTTVITPATQSQCLLSLR